MGIMLLQVASSEDETPKSYVFWMSPILRDEEKREQVQEQFDRLTETDEMVREFVEAMRYVQNRSDGESDTLWLGLKVIILV